ncbi:hypothetical protein ECG_02786 [Echinococcus granulosus]|uniref:Kazal-like domain-containing protein n=1 Tax=Echinococcus granulosus TaxID=6210 RepID=A0A068WKG9_ECHGR|nr:hypothetical protein ECG_02786 [Echinococcus granulosus]CDS20253.1 hypothetical protein EgrG_000246300 [Echinococcus granulosus]
MKNCKGIDSLKTDYPPKRSCCFNRSTGCTHDAVLSDERELSQPCQQLKRAHLACYPCLPMEDRMYSFHCQLLLLNGVKQSTLPRRNLATFCSNKSKHKK